MQGLQDLEVREIGIVQILHSTFFVIPTYVFLY